MSSDQSQTYSNYAPTYFCFHCPQEVQSAEVSSFVIVGYNMSKLEDAYEIVKNSERWDTMRTSVLCSLVGSLYAHLDDEESSSDFEMINSMVSLS